MEQQLLIPRIEDTANLAYRTDTPKFLGFLSLEECVAAERVLKSKNVDFMLFGGFDGAERKMLGCFPEWCSDRSFPITPVTVKLRSVDKLGHRDILGALMGTGLKREKVGDILIEEGRAVVFLCDDIVDFVIQNIEKMGRVGVTLSVGAEYPLPTAKQPAELSETVASKRLDCVVAAICRISRGDAVRKIEVGEVFVNSCVCEKITYTLSDGDAVTVRGVGKFLIDSFPQKTKKDRLVLKYKKYI